MFEDYSAALKRHEWGHYEIGREAAASIDRELLLFPVMEDCPSLERQANALANQILEQYRRRSAPMTPRPGTGSHKARGSVTEE